MDLGLFRSPLPALLTSSTFTVSSATSFRRVTGLPDKRTYLYDAVGNITSQATIALTALSIGYFTLNHGPVGTRVTISGTGLSTPPGADTVSFNGSRATATNHIATELPEALKDTRSNIWKDS